MVKKYKIDKVIHYKKEPPKTHDVICDYKAKNKVVVYDEYLSFPRFWCERIVIRHDNRLELWCSNKIQTAFTPNSWSYFYFDN